MITTFFCGGCGVQVSMRRRDAKKELKILGWGGGILCPHCVCENSYENSPEFLSNEKLKAYEGEEAKVEKRDREGQRVD